MIRVVCKRGWGAIDVFTSPLSGDQFIKLKTIPIQHLRRGGFPASSEDDPTGPQVMFLSPPQALEMAKELREWAERALVAAEPGIGHPYED